MWPEGPKTLIMLVSKALLLIAYWNDLILTLMCKAEFSESPGCLPDPPLLSQYTQKKRKEKYLNEKFIIFTHYMFNQLI